MAKAELRIRCGTWNSNLESYLLMNDPLLAEKIASKCVVPFCADLIQSKVSQLQWSYRSLTFVEFVYDQSKVVFRFFHSLFFWHKHSEDGILYLKVENIHTDFFNILSTFGTLGQKILKGSYCILWIDWHDKKWA